MAHEEVTGRVPGGAVAGVPSLFSIMLESGFLIRIIESLIDSISKVFQYELE